MEKKRRTYPPEFRQKILELIHSGKSAPAFAREFETSRQAVTNWLKQDDLDAGRRADGLSSKKLLAKAPDFTGVFGRFGMSRSCLQSDRIAGDGLQSLGLNLGRLGELVEGSRRVGDGLGVASPQGELMHQAAKGMNQRTARGMPSTALHRASSEHSALSTGSRAIGGVASWKSRGAQA